MSVGDTLLRNRASNRLAANLPFFYGYVVMPIAMLIQICTSPGQTFLVSAFTPALRESLALSDFKLSLAYMLGTLFAAMPLSVVGPLSDRFGIRCVTITVAFALAGACLFASKANGFLTLMIAFFLLRFLGQGAMTLMGTNAISMWFRSRIGRVSAAMSVGGAIAFAWIPSLVHDSIQTNGWRVTYQYIAIAVLMLLVPPMLLLFRNRPEEVGQSVDGIKRDQAPEEYSENKRLSQSDESEHALDTAVALKTASFWILTAVNIVWAMSGTGIVFYLFTLCEDRGLPESLSPKLFQTLGISMLTAQLLGGVVSDYVKPRVLLGIGTTCISLGCWFAWGGDSSLAMHGFALFFGLGQGMLLAVGAVVWVRYYGRTHLGAIRGTAWALTVAGSGGGPLLMGVMRDTVGNFDPAIGVFVVVSGCLALAAWFATEPAAIGQTAD